MINIDFASLRLIGLHQAIASQLVPLDINPGQRLLRITAVHRDCLAVHDGQQQGSARAPTRLLDELAQEDTALAVGDWVLVDASELITARLPPLSSLARRAPDGRRQVLANNVDTALLVMGLDHDFNPRRVERSIALVRAAGVQPVVVLTKADAGVDASARIALLRKRLPPGIEIIATDARSPHAAAALAPWLDPGQTLILLGTSGAGKSTLTNTLCESSQETGGVRLGDSRGRHTTTARSLHQCASGACIIDTPGLRSWSIDADAAQLGAAFEDIAALASQCQFRDCRHVAEPGCAVRECIDADRLLNYNKLLKEARRNEQTSLDRIADRARWKVLHKAAAARSRQKRE